MSGSGGPREVPPAVGNDVVDLTDPRCRGKGTEERFLQRVLAPSERKEVRVAPDADLALWRRWAAKEAAFKTVTRVRGSAPPFVHADFVVEEAGHGGGVVRWNEMSIPWRISGSRDGGGVHAVAWWSEDARLPVLVGGTRALPRTHVALEELVRDLTERERRAVHSPASALVRLRARAHLARLLSRDGEGLEVVCAEGPVGRMPPRILVDGEASRWSVSLSHHGGLVAWVLARWPDEGQKQGEVQAPPVAPRPGVGR